MRVSVVRPNELDDNSFAQWRRFLAADPDLGSPFLTPQFACAVGRHRPGARVAVLEDGPQVVGFLAFERDAERVGWPIGKDLADAQALIAEPGFECDLPTLVRRLGLCVWRFDHLVRGQALLS